MLLTDDQGLSFCGGDSTIIDIKRRATREATARARPEPKARVVQINERSPGETTRMRDGLTKIITGRAVNVCMDLRSDS